MKHTFNQKLIKYLQHLAHIDPWKVKYLLLDYHNLLKQPEVKVRFDGTEFLGSTRQLIRMQEHPGTD